MIGELVGRLVRGFLYLVAAFLLIFHTDTVIGVATTVVDAAKSTSGSIARFASHVGHSK